MSLKEAGLDRNRSCFEGVHEVIIESLCLCGGSGAVEARTPPAPAIPIKSKLGHNQESAARIHDVTIHAAFGIGKDSQTEDLVSKIVGIGLDVLS